ncbi:acetylglucosamine-6-sulfatase [Caulobacter sp. D4A]|uniref:sulfatase family protein n=1 Tax=unclassified Caulobacter TaxID=2648921 RepID=UPI000D72CF08|nr:MULTISPECIES: sulfatase [unclassified Caulobacter]PXA84237.1 acetylglucosamine-6-sulfatase [Caulobacter sp. D4A]PXA95990.1 acetylglucosamine-6-sulfatase [Caulobacter sp. D5]
MTQDTTTRGVLLAAQGLDKPFHAVSWDASSEEDASPRPKDLVLKAKPGVKPRNIVVVLTDDHRFDAMGFTGAQPFVETPVLDRLAAEGAHFKNAFVTTALCSPSRATIFTGLYAHQHRVVDNNHPIRPDVTFFPEYLQAAGYETAFIGKWHMGVEGDDPQRGFDHWISFKGQGDYWPNGDGLNVNGERVPQKGYLTDELTDYAMDWLESREGDKPWLLFLAHKAVHAEFIPAPRHLGRYDDAEFRYPESLNLPPEQAQGQPVWVKNQRNSWHGADFPYHTNLDLAHYYKRYAETMLSVDEGIGRVLDHLEARGDLDSTLVLYMGDNGFAFGEHGLIDKRTAYEESMRIPMLARCPELFPGGTVVEQVVANLDIAPTLLAVAGLEAPEGLQGEDMLPLTRGENPPWRTELLYEYYWERNFPQTPTVHAIRQDRYKYIHYHGVWDIDELYDLQADPNETVNLIHSPGHETVVARLTERLFQRLEEQDGLSIPLPLPVGGRHLLRDADGAVPADFPTVLLKARE